MQSQKFVTEHFGPVTIQRPVFASEDIKELRRLAGLARGSDKPMSQFDFSVAYKINYYTLTAWESKKRSPGYLPSLALAKIKTELEEQLQGQGQPITPKPTLN